MAAPFYQNIDDIQLDWHDGTSQRNRALAALDPRHVLIDERSTADLLQLVQEIGARLRYFTVDSNGQLSSTGTWSALTSGGNPAISVDEMVAYLADPSRFRAEAEKARWLGRPHFALLLTFLELLGQARQQMNGLTERHLDYHYRTLLQMQPEPARPDQVAVLFKLMPGAASKRLPAGTELDAGPDSAAQTRIYRTERELIVNSASIAELKSVWVNREIRGIADVLQDSELTVAERFDAALRLALGTPKPGDPVQKWQAQEVNQALVAGLRKNLDIFKDNQKKTWLTHDQFRQLMIQAKIYYSDSDAARRVREILAQVCRIRNVDSNWTLASTTLLDFGSDIQQAFPPELFNLSQGSGGVPKLHSVTQNYLDTINGYFRAMESSFSMSIEQLDCLVTIAEKCKPDGNKVGQDDWRMLEQLLTDAHRKKFNGNEPNSPVALPRTTVFRGLDAYADARACKRQQGQKGHKGQERWALFGREKKTNSVPATSVTPFGWALRSSLLALSQGVRTLTLTLKFQADSIDRHQQKEPKSISESWLIQISTAKGWVELTPVSPPTWPPAAEQPAHLQLTLSADAKCAPFAPLKDSADPWPTLRMLLQPGPAAQVFETLVLEAVELKVEVSEMTDLQLQSEDQPLDPRKPMLPFGRQPMVGARFYLSHPELVRERLDTLTVAIEWAGLPDVWQTHYKNYKNIDAPNSFQSKLFLLDSAGGSEPQATLNLFGSNDSDKNAPLVSKDKGIYKRQNIGASNKDLRLNERCWCIELTPQDFGDSQYSARAAEKMLELSSILSKLVDKPANFDVKDYHVNPPYTPTIQKIKVGYSSSIKWTMAELPASGTEFDTLLHIHPFGVAPITAERSTLLPKYEQAGELYIGVRDLQPAQNLPQSLTQNLTQNLTLLVQLAEGTAPTDQAPESISWSVLDDNTWCPVEIIHDSTRGLLNSGVIELALPQVKPSTLLPAGLTWLRVAVASHAEYVCDCIDIHAQAVMAKLTGHAVAPDHYLQPLPADSIQRLVTSDGQIAAVLQPYTSFGGRPAEAPEFFRTRVSERLRHKQRAVQGWDYERLVLQQFSQIFKAKCLPAHPQPGEVTLVVVPDIRRALPSETLAPKVSANVLADIQSYLAERAPPLAKIKVQNPRYVPVEVKLTVRFKPDQDENFAKARLNQDLIRFLSPWAFDEGADIMIGGKIYANNIIDFVDRCDYVDYIGRIDLFKGTAHVLCERSIDHHVAADDPDQVLVSADEHVIIVISKTTDPEETFKGIGYMQVDFDFQVH